MLTDVMRAAPTLSRTWLRAAFALALVGFGTKMGLAPMHTWLPDTHSQAPSPVSALLSGALLNCALLAILRFFQVCIKSGDAEFARNLLLVFGFTSLVVACVFMIGQLDYKRLLAYSSIENMGIVALAFGLGGPLGVAAGLFHMVSHSLAKPLAFMASGMMAFAFKTKEIPLIRGGAQVLPLVAIPFVFIAIGLAGSPPFGTYLSELGVLAASLSTGQWAVALLFILFAIITFASLLYRVSTMAFGAKPAAVQPYAPHWTMLLPFFVLLALTIYLGIFPPVQFINLLNLAVHSILGG
jgi:hydrogenase-4 component F